MRISIELNGNAYAIDVEANTYIPVKFGTNKATGATTETQLGFFSKLSNAALRICREEISQSTDTVSLKQFALLVENNNNQLREQLEAVGV